MKALAIVAMLAGMAVADPAPAGWAVVATPAAAPEPHLGSQTPAMSVQTFESPDKHVELVVTRTSAPAVGDVAAIVRAEVDGFHDASHRAQLAGGLLAEQSSNEHVDPAAKLVLAELAFHDATGGVTTTSRLAIAASATTLVEMIGTCLARDEADTAQAAACKAALAKLAPDLATADRIALAVAPEGTPAPERASQGPSMSESTHAPLPPIELPRPKAQTDRRPVFVGAGIVLLAAVFWWNMRRRARWQAEEDPDDR
jgi:hypothetical protein